MTHKTSENGLTKKLLPIVIGIMGTLSLTVLTVFVWPAIVTTENRVSDHETRITKVESSQQNDANLIDKVERQLRQFDDRQRRQDSLLIEILRTLKDMQ